MSETLTAQPPQPQEASNPASVAGRLQTWTEQFTGSNAEAAAILAQNTLHALGQTALSEELPPPHPSQPALSSKVEASRPTWQQADDSASQAPYATSSGMVYSGSEASALRSFDNRTANAQARLREAVDQSNPKSSLASRMSRSGTQGRPGATGDSRTSRHGSFLNGTPSGQASERAATVGRIEREDTTVRTWDEMGLWMSGRQPKPEMRSEP